MAVQEITAPSNVKFEEHLKEHRKRMKTAPPITKNPARMSGTTSASAITMAERHDISRVPTCMRACIATSGRIGLILIKQKMRGSEAFLAAA